MDIKSNLCVNTWGDTLYQKCSCMFYICIYLVFFFQVSNEATYQEVVRATCGKVTGVLCEVAIAIYTFGTCIAFFIVIGDQLDRCKCIQEWAILHSPPSTVILNCEALCCFQQWWLGLVFLYLV